MPPRLKQLIHEIHRRSLWQVTTIYVGASWFVLEVTDQVIERFLLPEWVYGVAIILLMIGLPICLATAFVREDVAGTSGPAGAATVSGSEVRAAHTESTLAKKGLAGKLFTWPKAILGGVLAFLLLGLVSAYVVLRGTARVTDAYGVAGEAFGEREWIVVAEFEASEGEDEIALAAREALTIDLHQSEYVNVYGRDQVRPVLRRMGLPDTVRLGRRLALEIAEREGLAAVLAGQVNRLGGDYQFTGRVIEPGSGRELIAVRTAASADHVIQGVESLSREVRSRLGEEAQTIRQSRPLPAVTTMSLEALKLYAQAVNLTGRQDYAAALNVAADAIRLDSTFAMAYRLASVASNNLGRFGESRRYVRRAYELRDRLTELERLHVEGFYHTAVTVDYRRAADAYERILSRYPDDFRAANNLGVVAGFVGDLERAFDAYMRGLELSPNVAAHSNAVSMAYWTKRWDAADSIIVLAIQRGFGDQVGRYRAAGAFARGDLDRADALCDSLLSVLGSPGLLAYQRQTCGSLDLARGRIDRGVERLKSAIGYYLDVGQSFMLHNALGALMVAEQTRDRPGAAVAALDAMLPPDSMGGQDRLYVSTGLQIYAGVLDRPDLLQRVAMSYTFDDDLAEWQRRYGAAMAGAAAALTRNDHDEALALLEEGTKVGYQPTYWAAQRHLLYGLAHEGTGDVNSAIAELEGAIDPGGIANWWNTPAQVHLPAVLLRLGELEEARGNEEAAARHYRRFLDLWAGADPEVRGRIATAQRALARLTAEG